MSSVRKTLFISDIHLQEQDEATTARFMQFMQSINQDVDALYILGDLFEVWIGDDGMTPFHHQIIRALKRVTEAGIPVYLIHGNRDFLLGKEFFIAIGCVLLPDESVRSFYGTDALLMHGDTLCTQDRQYQRARKILRNRFVQYLFLRLPLSFRQNLANKIREGSKEYTRRMLPNHLDAVQTTVEKVMNKHEVHTLIHGHTHLPAIHSFMLKQQAAKRVVLGAWHHQMSIFSWDNQGQIELRDKL